MKNTYEESEHWETEKIQAQGVQRFGAAYEQGDGEFLSGTRSWVLLNDDSLQLLYSLRKMSATPDPPILIDPNAPGMSNNLNTSNRVGY
jgi:hypothetical protein